MKRSSKFTSKLILFGKYIWFIVSILVAIFYVQFSSLPLSGIKVNMKPYVLPQIIPISESQEFSNFHLFSGYGLFRSMTGVGSLTKNQQKSVKMIGGMLPSIVSRPEIILEGFDKKTNTWIEIPFKYKPDNIYKIPPINLPHQPRLDWQMWFAALGKYEHNPWFVHLVYKLLQGDNPEVISLLDESSYPFKDTPPLAIRSILYEYDFTRLNTTWNVNIPDTKILSNYSINSHFTSPSSLFSILSSSLSSSTSSKISTFPWWQRKRVIREYLVQLDLTNPSLKQYLEGNGYKLTSFKSLQERELKCYDSESNYQKWICYVVFTMRKFFNKYDIWMVLNSVVLLVIFQVGYEKFHLNKKKRRKNEFYHHHHSYSDVNDVVE